MDDLKTIGEVEKQTGIPKRTLKYYIERGFIRPSQKANSGYWLYSSTDIKQVQRIDLYHELGYPDAKIKALLEGPNFDWQAALKTQISELKEKRKHLNRLLYAAEIMRLADEDEERIIDISLFDGDIDKFVQDSVLSAAFSPQTMKDTRKSLIEFSAADEVTGDKNFFVELLKIMDQDPSASTVQEQIGICCQQFKRLGAKSPYQLLVIVRLMADFAEPGLDFYFSLFSGKTGFVRFFIKALERYCDACRDEDTED